MRQSILVFCLLLLGLVQLELAAQPTPAVHRNGRYGLKKADGTWLLRPRYTAVHAFSEGRAAVQRGKYWGFVDERGKWVEKPNYLNASDFHSGLAAVFDETLGWFYIHSNGDFAFRLINNNSILQPGDFRGEIAFVQLDRNGRTAMITKTGGLLLDHIYQTTYDSLRQQYKLHYSASSYTLVSRFAYFDTLGNRVSEECLNDFDLRQAPVRVTLARSLKHNFLNSAGKPILANDYDEIMDLQGGMYLLKTRGYYAGAIDRDIRFVVPEGNYSFISFFTNNILYCRSEKGYAYYSKEGKLLVESADPLTTQFNAFVLRDARGYTVLDSMLQPLFPEPFATLQSVSNGTFAQRGEHWGFFDKQWKERIPVQYTRLEASTETPPRFIGYAQGHYTVFSEDYQAHCSLNSSAAIRLIPGKRDTFELVENGSLRWITRTGKKLLPTGFEDIVYSYISDGLLLVRHKGKWGMTDLQGKWLIQPQYQQLDRMDNVVLAVKNDAEMVVLTTKGKFLANLPKMDYRFFPESHALLLRDYISVNQSDRYCLVHTQKQRFSGLSACSNLKWETIRNVVWAEDQIARLEYQASSSAPSSSYSYFHLQRGLFPLQCTEEEYVESAENESWFVTFIKVITFVPIVVDAIAQEGIFKKRGGKRILLHCEVKRFQEAGLFVNGKAKVRWYDEEMELSSNGAIIK